jgi:putative SOS response-associated peptidase YedK
VCGRFVAASPPADIASYFGATLPETALPGNYNVAPTSEIYAVVDSPNGPSLQVFHWGLIPSWAKDRKIASKMINARSETITEKSMFAKLFATRRCIIPADGFYEWKTVSSGKTPKKPAKQPYLIHRMDGEPLAMAGIWTSWRDPAGHPGELLHSASIITTAANETMAPLHDRMPVMLPVGAWSTWLDTSFTDTDRLKDFLVPAPMGLLTVYPVSTDVNSVRNGGPDLIKPVAEQTQPDE